MACFRSPRCRAGWAARRGTEGKLKMKRTVARWIRIKPPLHCKSQAFHQCTCRNSPYPRGWAESRGVGRRQSRRVRCSQRIRYLSLKRAGPRWYHSWCADILTLDGSLRQCECPCRHGRCTEACVPKRALLNSPRMWWYVSHGYHTTTCALLTSD